MFCLGVSFLDLEISFHNLFLFLTWLSKSKLMLSPILILMIALMLFLMIWLARSTHWEIVEKLYKFGPYVLVHRMEHFFGRFLGPANSDFFSDFCAVIVVQMRSFWIPTSNHHKESFSPFVPIYSLVNSSYFSLQCFISHFEFQTLVHSVSKKNCA